MAAKGDQLMRPRRPLAEVGEETMELYRVNLMPNSFDAPKKQFTGQEKALN